MYKTSKALCLTLFVLIAAGCATLPTRNKPLERFAQEEGYRFQNVAPGQRNSDSLFVILTFSGGGTRAAALAYGVLEQLRDTEIVWEGQNRRLLDEVDVISSVSGGSLPAAYLALFGDRIFEDFPQRVLYRNIQGELVKAFLAIRNYARLASPFYGRTDLMADKFTREFFDQCTFGDLTRRNRRPFAIINATDLTLGTPFEFTQEQFDLLNSDLSQYPIGNAVAASAAFPGLLTPVVLNNYQEDIHYEWPDWIRDEVEQMSPTEFDSSQGRERLKYLRPGSPYVHLADGGISDNLGLWPVIRAIRRLENQAPIWPGVSNQNIKKLVVITVNAKVKRDISWGLESRVASLFHVLGVVASAPIANVSMAEIEYVKLCFKRLELERRYAEELAKHTSSSAEQTAAPQPAACGIDYTFVDVSFDQIENDNERQYLNTLPTSFSLRPEQVDRVRKAAAEIMQNHPALKRLLDGIGCEAGK